MYRENHSKEKIIRINRNIISTFPAIVYTLISIVQVLTYIHCKINTDVTSKYYPL